LPLWVVSTHAALLAILALGACRRAAAPPPSAAASSPSSAAAAGDLRPLAAEARRDYQEAQRLVYVGNLEEAQAALERAVAAQPDFTEGWYNLGATYSSLAVREAGEGHDATALELVKKAVSAKNRARELMGSEAWFLYDERQRQTVREDVAHALEDADAVLADPASLLVALRLRARGVRHPGE
jgi:tetratricopeptide (TPR) repeat protein